MTQSDNAKAAEPDARQIEEAARRLDEKADRLTNDPDRAVPLPQDSDDEGAGDVGGLVP